MFSTKHHKIQNIENIIETAAQNKTNNDRKFKVEIFENKIHIKQKVARNIICMKKCC